MSTREDARRLLEQRRGREQREVRANRTPEFVLLIVASLLVGTGFRFVYAAKKASFDYHPSAPNLNALHNANELLPVLNEIADPTLRQYTAGRIFDFSKQSAIPNVGALSRLRGRNNLPLL